MERRAWRATIHGVAKAVFSMPTNLESSVVATGLEKVSFHFNPKEKECHRMLKLLHSCAHLTKWQPTPVFLPGESQGRGSLVGCRLWGRTESDTTEVT